MKEIKCPKCGEVFQVDEAGYAAIASQVRDKEFTKELAEREQAIATRNEAAVKLIQSEAKNELEKLNSQKELEISRLKAQLEARDGQAKAELDRLKSEFSAQRAKDQLDAEKLLSERDKKLAALEEQIRTDKSEAKLELAEAVAAKDKELAKKEEELEYYKNYKTSLSTKAVGESLEKYCETEFNKLRSTAFMSAYFEKDNDAREGSKGDYIFRDYSDGVEFVSIMFEMKNEMDQTATKHKNEDFFKKLDSDRTKKGCEYAVLVSMLEADSELYNEGIVDVSYRYPKMYVIRPQFFIPIISLIRNAGMESVKWRLQLAETRQQNVDLTNFEANIRDFRERFTKNARNSVNQSNEAVKRIDEAIKELEKVKEALRLTGVHMERALGNVEDDLTVKKLTKNAPSVEAQLKALREGGEE